MIVVSTDAAQNTSLFLSFSFVCLFIPAYKVNSSQTPAWAVSIGRKETRKHTRSSLCSEAVRFSFEKEETEASSQLKTTDLTPNRPSHFALRRKVAEGGGDLAEGHSVFRTGGPAAQHQLVDARRTAVRKGQLQLPFLKTWSVTVKQRLLAESSLTDILTAVPKLTSSPSTFLYVVEIPALKS